MVSDLMAGFKFEYFSFVTSVVKSVCGVSCNYVPHRLPQSVLPVPTGMSVTVTASPALPDSVLAFLEQQSRLERTGEAGLDFTMQYLHYLCLKDIQDCHLLLSSLVSPSDRKETVQTNKYKLFGFIPRYGYLLTFIPFFPVMFLFTGSGGLAFFITAASEMILRWDNTIQWTLRLNA